MNHIFIIKSGVILSLLCVVIGAFGAHLFANMIGEKLDVFKTAIKYQMFHSLAIIIVGILAKIFHLDLKFTYYLFCFGIVLFCGSLYLISLFKYSFLGAITPLGGILFILGWVVLFYKLSYNIS
tara:strand:- start:119 stop:490 length:372 start_codon:yes stop_codon:yes gene_type:complete